MSRIRKNIAWKTLGTAIEKGLRLVLVGYVARALGIRVYGQYTYAVAVAMLAVSPTASSMARPRSSQTVARDRFCRNRRSWLISTSAERIEESSLSSHSRAGRSR